jgi:ferredoxin
MTGRAWALVADLDLCQAHQMCLLEAPDLVGFDKAADKVVVRWAQPADELRGQAEQAVAHCPALALSIVESVVERPVEED